MIRDDSLSSSITKLNGGNVTFGDNSKGKIIGFGNIWGKSSLSNEKQFLINSLKHNLLIISQLYDKGYKIIFNYACCLIFEDDKLIYIGNRKINAYKIKIDACMRIKSCLVASINDSFLWHGRLGYISIDILSKLVKNDLVKGLSHIAFKKEKLCDAFKWINKWRLPLSAKITFQLTNWHDQKIDVFSQVQECRSNK